MRQKKELRGICTEKKIVLKINKENNTLVDGIGNVITIPNKLMKYVDTAINKHQFNGESYLLCRLVQNDKYVHCRPLKRYTADTNFDPNSSVFACPLIFEFLAKDKQVVKVHKFTKSNEVKDGRELEKSMLDEEGNYNPNWTENVIFGYDDKLEEDID